MLNLSTTTVTPSFHSKFKGDARELIEAIVKKGLNREVNSLRRGHHEVLAPQQLTPLESQRNAKSSWVKKALTLGDGFDRIAAGLIQVARTPNGENLVWDGCGRLALAEACDIQDLDCWVFDLSAQEAAHYFVYVQKTSNRSLKPGELFINAYEKGATEAVEFAEVLKRLGLRIQGADDYWVPRVTIAQRKDYPEVRERSVKQALKYAGKAGYDLDLTNLSDSRKTTVLKMTDEDIVRFARDTIVQAGWNDDQIRQDLLPGLVIVYKCYPELFFNGLNTNFRSYFKALAGTVTQGKLEFKKIGGNLHNHEAESVAIGIVKGFHGSPCKTPSQGQIVVLKRVHEYLKTLSNDVSEDEDLE
jgi:hypothetical protein